MVKNMAEARVTVLRILWHPVSLTPREVSIASGQSVSAETAGHVLERLESEKLVVSRPVGRTDSTLPFMRRFSITDEGRVALEREETALERKRVPPSAMTRLVMATPDILWVIGFFTALNVLYAAGHGEKFRAFVLLACVAVLWSTARWIRNL